MWITPLGSNVCIRTSPHIHAIHDERLSVCSSLFLRSDSLRVSLLHLALLFPLLPVLCPEPFLPCGQRLGNHTLRLRQLKSLALWQNSVLPPKLLDDFHYSKITGMIFKEESDGKDTEPSYWCDTELDDETIGKALSSTLFIQEREKSADPRQAYHSHEASLLPVQSFFAHQCGETRART